LKKDPKKRPHISDLMEHEWIKEFKKDPTICQKQKLNVSDNLISFRKNSVLQRGVLSFMTNLMASQEEMKEMGELFKKLDTSNDGFLSMGELNKGLQGTMGSFKYSNEDWEGIIKGMDSNGDGQVDF